MQGSDILIGALHFPIQRQFPIRSHLRSWAIAGALRGKGMSDFSERDVRFLYAITFTCNSSSLNDMFNTNAHKFPMNYYLPIQRIPVASTPKLQVCNFFIASLYRKNCMCQKKTFALHSYDRYPTDTGCRSLFSYGTANYSWLPIPWQKIHSFRHQYN